MHRFLWWFQDNACRKPAIFPFILSVQLMGCRRATEDAALWSLLTLILQDLQSNFNCEQNGKRFSIPHHHRQETQIPSALRIKAGLASLQPVSWEGIGCHHQPSASSNQQARLQKRSAHWLHLAHLHPFSFCFLPAKICEIVVLAGEFSLVSVSQRSRMRAGTQLSEIFTIDLAEPNSQPREVQGSCLLLLRCLLSLLMMVDLIKWYQ